MTKQEQRTILKNRLAKLTNTEKIEYSNKIKKNLISLLNTLDNKSINIYLSFQNEVMTDDIIKYLLENHYKVSVPILDKETLASIKIDKNTKYQNNKFNIKEPINKVKQNFDIAIIPLLGFDQNKNRLGRGKGYYDRFLANKNVIKIGLAYSIQELDHIIINQYDTNMDYIINEKGIIK